MKAAPVRGHVADHLLVRLASEGIPLAAIARVTLTSLADVKATLELSRSKLGGLKTIPPLDWPNDSRVREPTIPPLSLEEIQPLSARLQGYMRFTGSEARFLAALMLFGYVDRPTMRSIVSLKELTDEKVIDVHACRIRKQLREFDIEFETVWGRGFIMAPAEVRKVVALIRVAESTHVAA